MPRLIVVLVLVLVLVLGWLGCASDDLVLDPRQPHSIHYADVEYPTKEAALAAQRADYAAQIAVIEPRPRLGGSLLIHRPTDAELTRPPFATQVIEPDYYLYSAVRDYWQAELEVVRDGLRRSALFDRVDLAQSADANGQAIARGDRYLLLFRGEEIELRDVRSGAVADLSSADGADDFLDEVEAAVRGFPPG